jgi:hypothetical protein
MVQIACPTCDTRGAGRAPYVTSIVPHLQSYDMHVTALRARARFRVRKRSDLLASQAPRNL